MSNGKRSGYDTMIYINESAWSVDPEDWAKLAGLMESGLQMDQDEIESKTRDEQYTEYDLAWTNARITSTVRLDNTNTQHLALQAASATRPPTVIGVAVGPRNAVVGDKLFAFECVVKVGEEGHDNSGMVTKVFEFLPAARGVQKPQVITLAA